MRQWSFVAFVLIQLSLVFGENGPDLDSLDTTAWRDPNDPFGKTLAPFDSNLRQKCDCTDKTDQLTGDLSKCESELAAIEVTRHQVHENFTKELLSELLYALEIDLDVEVYIMKRLEITLDSSGIDVLKRFMATPRPSLSLKAELKNELKSINVEQLEIKNRSYSFFVSILPITVAIVAFPMLLILVYFFRYWFHFPTMFPVIILLVILHGMYEKYVADYDAAVSKQMAIRSQLMQSGEPCTPPTYFEAGFRYAASFFVRVGDDDCTKYYMNAVTDVKPVFNLGSNFSYVAGSLFVGFFVAIAHGINSVVDALTKDLPIGLQSMAVFIAAFVMILFLIFLLRAFHFQVSTPLVTVGFSAGQQHHQLPPPPPQPIHSLAPVASAPALQQSQQRPATLPTLPTPLQSVEFRDITDNLSDHSSTGESYCVLDSPNVTLRRRYRSESLKRRSASLGHYVDCDQN